MEWKWESAFAQKDLPNDVTINNLVESEIHLNLFLLHPGYLQTVVLLGRTGLNELRMEEASQFKGLLIYGVTQSWFFSVFKFNNQATIVLRENRGQSTQTHSLSSRWAYLACAKSVTEGRLRYTALFKVAKECSESFRHAS